MIHWQQGNVVTTEVSITSRGIISATEHQVNHQVIRQCNGESLTESNNTEQLMKYEQKLTGNTDQK